MLKGHRGIAIPLLHNVAYECANNHDKCIVFDMFRYDVYLLVCIRHIQFEPVFCISNIVLDQILIREQGEVLNSVKVPFPTVYDCTKSSQLLQHAQ